MAKTLRVEQQELLSRAAELEAPLPAAPTENPRPPCALASAQNAARQLSFSADNMRDYLAAGDRERRRLAQSLRNAAKAYGRIDEANADALNSGDLAAVSAFALPFPAHWDPKLRIPRGQVVAAASIVSPKY